MSPKRGAYPREVREEAVRLLRGGRDLYGLARELGVTPGSLRVWRFVAEGGDRDAWRTREAVIGKTVGAFERLDRVLRSVPDCSLELPMPFDPTALDPWRVIDAVAHLTHYKARVIHRLTKDGPRSRLTGAAGSLADYWDRTAWAALEAADTVLPTMDERAKRRHGPNHLVYERWRSRPAGEVLAWHRLVHEHVVSTLRRAPETWFSTDGRSPPLLSRSAASALAAHYDTHLGDIQRAVRQGQQPHVGGREAGR